MALQTNIAKLRSVAGRYGLSGLGVHLGRRVLTVAPGGQVQRFFLFALEQAQASPRSLEASKGHTFRLATVEDIERYRGIPEAKIFDRDVAAIKSGNRCLLQLDEDKLVGYSWVAASQLVELLWGFHFNMPDDMAYNYNGYTAPEYRGKSFQGLRHLKMLELVQQTGQKRLFGYVDHMNYNSLRGLAKSGYKQIGVLRAIKKGGKIHFDLQAEDNSWSELVRAGPQQT